MFRAVIQIEREVESFNGLMYSMFKNEEHLPGMGIDLGGYSSPDVFRVSSLRSCRFISISKNNDLKLFVSERRCCYFN